MNILWLIVLLILQSLIGGFALWLSARILKNELKFVAGVLIALISALCGGVVGSFLGYTLSSVVNAGVMLLLLSRWSTIDRIVPDGVILVVVAVLIQVVITFLFLMTIGALVGAVQ